MIKGMGRRRNEKYQAKIDAEVIGGRYDSTKELAVGKFARSVDRQVELEVKTKTICHDVSTIYLPYYIIFAKQLNKVNNWTERNILYNKWGMRGLDWYKLLQIENWLFGMTAELRYANDLSPRVLHLPFYEGQGTLVRDASGKGHNGTITGATWNTQGKVGNCLYYDGDNDKVTISNHADFASGAELSISAWIKPKLNGTDMIVVYNWSVDVTQKRYFLRRIANEKLQFYWNDGASHNIVTTTTLPINEWNHMVITLKSGEQKIYINGIERASGSFVGIIQNSNENLLIGLNHINTEDWKGKIDELILWDRVLTPAEILEYYNLTKNYGND